MSSRAVGGLACTMEVRDPWDASLVGRVPRATPADALAAVDQAAVARDVARRMPVHQRMSVLQGAADRIAAEAEGFARLIAREGIKTIREARREVARCVGTLRLCAEEARRLTGETIAFDQVPGGEGRSGYYTREPVGVVLAITPFNDPLNLVAHKVGPGIAAGCPVILKPHERTPLSALKLADALSRAGLPAGVLQVLTGDGRELGPALLGDDRVRLVSFTGGVEAGRRVATMAGLKRLEMELGGNCPTLVLADADLDGAAAACISGAFWAAGQNCLHVQRIIADRSVYEPFRDRLRQFAAGVRLGPKLDEATDMGCLIDAVAAERVERLLASAVQDGARVVTGGRRRGPTGFEPTLVEGVSEDHPLMTTEVFGPVTVLAAAHTFEDAVEWANATDYGLHAAVFTRDLGLAHEAVHRLEAGAVMVNDSTDYRIDAMPFGGVKLSARVPTPRRLRRQQTSRDGRETRQNARAFVFLMDYAEQRRINSEAARAWSKGTSNSPSA